MFLKFDISLITWGIIFNSAWYRFSKNVGVPNNYIPMQVLNGSWHLEIGYLSLVNLMIRFDATSRQLLSSIERGSFYLTAFTSLYTTRFSFRHLIVFAVSRNVYIALFRKIKCHCTFLAKNLSSSFSQNPLIIITFVYFVTVVKVYQ